MPSRLRFRTGERIPYPGIYRVFHASHRLPHEVTLLDGETFPRCLKCDDAVEFQLIQQAPNIRNEGEFRVVLFGLPPTDELLEDGIPAPAHAKEKTACAGDPGIPTPAHAKEKTACAGDPGIATESVERPTGTEGRSDEATPTATDGAGEGFAQSTFHQPDSLLGDGKPLGKTKRENWPKFKPGDLIPECGVYSVEHDSHGLFHQVTLAKDALFPRCQTCGSEVRFRLVRSLKPGSVMPPLSSAVLENLEAQEPPSKKVG